MSKHSKLSEETPGSIGIRRRFQNATFASLYRFGGRVYDPLTRLLFGRAWARWRRAILPYLPDGTVLDLGCGTGVFENELSKKGYVACGVDREMSMVRKARTVAPQSLIVQGEANALPFRSATFDACVSTFPSRFVFERNTLDEVARILRPRGTFAIVLSGQTDDWSRKRAPIRLALRLFYGSPSQSHLPDLALLTHGALLGDWRWLNTEPDHVLIWLSARSAESDAGG